jgi:hypothetical protein
MTPIVQLSTLAKQINSEHNQCEEALGKAVYHAYRCGILLTQAKQAIPHGQWGEWLKTNCIVGQRMAQNYMRIADNYSPETLPAHGSIREAIAALAEPKTKHVSLLPESIPPQDFEIVKQKGQYIKLPRPKCQSCGTPAGLNQLTFTYPMEAVLELSQSESGREMLANQAKRFAEVEAKRGDLVEGTIKPTDHMEGWVSEGGYLDEPWSLWWSCPKCGV